MNFSSNFFLKVGLIGCFRELNVRKFRKFSPDHFYDTENRFYDKKTDFRPETWKSMTSETTWETVIGSWQALHVITDFPFYGYLSTAAKRPSLESMTSETTWESVHGLSENRAQLVENHKPAMQLELLQCVQTRVYGARAACAGL